MKKHFVTFAIVLLSIKAYGVDIPFMARIPFLDDYMTVGRLGIEFQYIRVPEPTNTENEIEHGIPGARIGFGSKESSFTGMFSFGGDLKADTRPKSERIGYYAFQLSYHLGPERIGPFIGMESFSHNIIYEDDRPATSHKLSAGLSYGYSGQIHEYVKWSVEGVARADRTNAPKIAPSILFQIYLEYAKPEKTL